MAIMEANTAHEYEHDLDEDILFLEEDIRGGEEECSRSLIGRIFTDHLFSQGIMEAMLGPI